MRAESVDAACLTDPVSIAYLTGFASNPHERLMALVLGGDSAVLVVPGLEEESATAAARGATVRAWRDGEDPWAAGAGALDRAAPPPPRAGGTRPPTPPRRGPLPALAGRGRP